MKETFSPTVLIKDEYGDERTVTPPGWVWILAFAMAGCQWAIDEIESGKFDYAAMNVGSFI